jgi:hypothetical protein
MANLTFPIDCLGESSVLDALGLVHRVSVGTDPFFEKNKRRNGAK